MISSRLVRLSSVIELFPLCCGRADAQNINLVYNQRAGYSPAFVS